MNIKACHKALQSLLNKTLTLAFVKGMDPQDQQILTCNDTDNVKYKITGHNQKVSLLMFCIDLEKIYTYAGQYLKKTYYSEFIVKIQTFKDEECLEITLNNQILEVFTKNFKETNQTGILTGKQKFDAIFKQLSKRLACIKRHFFASPFQMMLITAKNNYQNKPAQNLQNLCFYTKPDRKEKVWLAFQKNQFTVYYGITYEDRFEQQLARIYFSQLVDAKKHVQNSPSVSVFESQLSEYLIQSFPEQKKQKYNFTNGIVSLTIFGKLVTNPRTMASYLAGFRNYSYYHIQAQKCYLHSRVLRRIDNFHKDLTLSKIQEQTKK